MCTGRTTTKCAPLVSLLRYKGQDEQMAGFGFAAGQPRWQKLGRVADRLHLGRKATVRFLLTDMESGQAN